MKKKIIGIIVAFILIAAVIPLSVVSANAGNQLDHVSITPDSVVLPLGGTQQFSAVGENEDNQPVNGVLYSWEVVNGGGTIDPATGFFTAGDTIDEFTDTVKVTATKGGITVTAYADVTVAIHGVLDTVVISPDSVTIEPLGTQQFTSVGYDAYGDPIESGVVFTWEVVNGGGTIDDPASGYFTAGTVTGTFKDTIVVTAVQGTIVKYDYADVKVATHGVLDTVIISPDSVTIEPLGTQQFTAVGYDAYGDPIESGVDFTWNVINGGGTIDPDTGLFTAGDVIDKFTDTIEVTAVQGTVTKYEYATVTVAEPSLEKEYIVPPGWSHGNKNGWGDGDTPPGWSKGNKTGWDGKGYPPGLGKEK
jgi:hypothetical protein